MHPAISVIFFTVSSGAGLGFIFLLGLGWPMPEGFWASFLIPLLAGSLTIAGLLSSTFHLGHPERAWRALSQWRSSWLSREGIVAIATLCLFGIYTLIWMLTGYRILILGIITSLLAIITVLTTAMIYTQLKTVPNWHTPLTVMCYLAFSITTGILLAGAFASQNLIAGIHTSLMAVLALFIAWAIKLIWWQRADKIGFSNTGSNTGTATGLGFLGKVHLLEKPHSGENYLTKEMVHQIGRKHAYKLRIIALIFGFILPVTFSFIVFISEMNFVFFILAFISIMVGLFAERWLFFAQAKHAVSLYY